jgi:CO/xanthine dehydrogenase FAD-binding subunit
LARWNASTPQIRNRANLAAKAVTASTAGDTLTPLMARKAEPVK